jgi:hypothetical protein
MVNKTASICDSVLNNNTDLFIITESWIDNSKMSFINADICSSLEGYSLLHALCGNNRKGGGICILGRTGLKMKENKTSAFRSFEHLDFRIRGKTQTDIFTFLVIYRPPTSAINKCSVADFLDEFTTLLESVVNATGHLVILGDFNIRMDVVDCPDTSRFLDLLLSFGLCQHVQDLTHEKGHSIDLVITRTADQCLSPIKIDFSLPSDHAALHFKTTMSRSQPTKSVTAHRPLKAIDQEMFRQQLSTALSGIGEIDDVDALTTKYDEVIISTLDQLAPVKLKTIVRKTRAKWFSADLLYERQSLRSLERRWLKSKLTVDKLTFDKAKLDYKNHCNELKSEYYKLKIDEAENVFKVVDEISGEKAISANILPDSVTPEMFAEFFVEKIDKIRTGLNCHTDIVELLSADTKFESFQVLSVDDVKKIVCEMKNKSCALDPMPTYWVKKYLSELSPILTRIVNTSLQEGVFPLNCKNALVKPLIKKPEMDRNVLKNYRPVSNCSFVDKLLEKCAYIQINKYLSQNSLYGKYQSAYRETHSCETALLRVHNDLMLALDMRKDVILIMLDLSAAFDTIDHNVLLQRLRLRFGFDGVVLDWIRSFMCGRSQQIVINRSMVSDKQPLKYGVPQGSILGPLFFALYVTPLEDVIARHGCSTVIFADDTQVYITCETSDSVSVIENCVAEIREWMMSNFLSLNDAKTEFVCFNSKFKRSEPICDRFQIGDSVIRRSLNVRNLGVIFDDNATMSNQVTNVCKSATYSLWRLGRIRHLLNNKTAEKLIHALVSSRIDYCNSVLAGIQCYNLRKLQAIQNSAARLTVTSYSQARSSAYDTFTYR